MTDLKTFVSSAVVIALACGVPLRVAAQDVGQDAATSVNAPGVVGEAAVAVVDRVFGVKGEGADIKYHAIELSVHSPLNAGIRSALLPGWGQRFNRQPVKSAVVFTAVVLGGYGAVRSYDRAKDDYNEYKSIGNRNDSSYDDYSRRRTQALALGGAAIGLWIYSIIDAYRYAYNPLFTQEPAVQLALQGDGASVEWRRRF